MPDTPYLDHVQCLDSRGLHRMAYRVWGERDNPRVLLCVHGLLRQGHDFDTLARAMSATHRVVCPDVVGRGISDRLPDPMGYQIPQYVADMVTLLARLDAEEVHWVGTSMGGLIGLAVAALEHSPIQRLVINDVGPRIEPAGIARIGGYVGRTARWATLDEAADALWQVSHTFGPHTREQWLALTEPQLVRDADGFYVPRADPGIALPFKAVTPEIAAQGEALTWAAWDRLAIPTLLLRGAESDLLSHATAQAMTQRGPRARLVEFAGVGHAPMLQHAEQVQVVREFLLAP